MCSSARPVSSNSSTRRRNTVSRLRVIEWLLLATASLGLTGCAAIQQRMANRCEKCSSLCERAREAREQGWPDQADLLLNEALRQRPKDLETRRQLAEALWEAGRVGEAIIEYQELSELHPRDSRLHQRLAVMQWADGQRDAAVRSAVTTLRFDPNCTDALQVKARAEASRRDFDEAIATYIRLTRLAPDQVDAKLELAEVHVQRGNPCQATSLLRDVLQQSGLSDAERADVEWKLGLAYCSADRWSEAATHLRNAAAERKPAAEDMQLLAAVVALADEDASDLPKMAQVASVNPSTSSTKSGWTDLRDDFLQRQQKTATSGGFHDQGVIRADFERNAMTNRPQSTESTLR